MPKVSRKIDWEILKGIFDNIPVSLNVFDLNGRRIYVNPYYYHLAGKTDQVAVNLYLTKDGKKFNDYLNQKVSAAIATGKNFEVHNYYYHSRQTETRRYLDIIIGPIKDPNGKVIGAYSMAKDVTARYLAKQKLMRLKRDLEKIVEERTEKLSRANRKLVRLAGEKNAMVSDIAHEIKTILTIIRGNLDIINFEMKTKTPLESECRSEIDKEIDKLSQITSDLVFLSRSEAYANTLSEETIDLGELIQSVVNDYQVLQEKRKIKVIIAAHQNRPVIVVADRSRLTTLVGNLHENALKFGKEKGRVEIFIKAGKIVNLIIQDDGVGIEKKKLPYVFDPFFQAKKTNDHQLQQRGFGLGLAICQKIVSAYKGTIRVESAGLGKGAKFIVNLPLRTSGEK